MVELKNLNIENILRDAKELKLSKNTSYHKSYPEFIKYLKGNNPIKEHELIIASHFVYSWMPTIIKIDLSEKNQVLDILNEVKSNKLFTLTIKELKILKRCINNSIVGVSKLLHFIAPKKYAIWDSRILRYSTGQKSQYHIGNEKLYLEYLSKVKEIAKDKDYKKVHQLVEDQLAYKVSPLRVIELVMFETDKKRGSKNKN